MIKAEYLECPSCHNPKTSFTKIGNSTEPDYICASCGDVFPIILALPEAINGGKGEIPSFARESDIGFDERWRQHPAPQPTPSEQFIAKTGMNPKELEGKAVLDGGCGIGRYCKFALEQGASTIIGVDISNSGLLGAAKNTAQSPNANRVQLVQGSLLNLPIKSNCIDIAYSIGVLHHLSNPAQGFAEIARTVRPGGKFAIWVYTNPVLDEKWRPMVDLLHDITRTCPPQALYKAIEKHAVKIRDTYYPEWGPLQQVMRPAYNQDDEQCISDMFDWHTPQYRFYHTLEEVKSWYTQNGFDVCWTGDFPVSACGIKR